MTKEEARATLADIMEDVAGRIRATEYVTTDFETLVRCYIDLYRAYMEGAEP